MDYKHIQELLDKYWAGKSSVEEERVLKQFFSEEEVPEEWAIFQPLFAYLDTSGRITPEKSFDPPSGIVRPLYKRSSWRFIAIAATLFFVICIGYLLFPTQNRKDVPKNTFVELLPKDTYEDPEEAYEAAKEALLLLSSKMKAGRAMILKEPHLKSKKDEE
ncbi:MAG: hypothetical protein AAF694_24620 [Bacteroidota bacterium]